MQRCEEARRSAGADLSRLASETLAWLHHALNRHRGPGEQRVLHGVLRLGVEPRVESAARPPPGEERAASRYAHSQLG